jgi:septal ring factor EnvC (AmiA/AmiB activator)
MRPTHRFALALVIVLPFVTACSNPRAEANTAAALNDAANEIGGLRSDIAQLQTQLDSLRTIVAKHDTSITHIAAVNNVPIVR